MSEKKQIKEENQKKFDSKKILEEAEQYCVFCDIISKKKPIIFQNEEITVLKDIDQASSVWHILICPNEHIENVEKLSTLKDLELLMRMKDKAQKILKDKYPGYEQRLGFHKPPMVSVDHLHLHGFVLPIKNQFVNLIKYGKLLHSCEEIEKEIEDKIDKIAKIC